MQYFYRVSAQLAMLTGFLFGSAPESHLPAKSHLQRYFILWSLTIYIHKQITTLWNNRTGRLIRLVCWTDLMHETVYVNNIEQPTVLSQKFVLGKYKMFGWLKVIAIPTLLLVCIKFAWSDFGSICTFVTTFLSNFVEHLRDS